MMGLLNKFTKRAKQVLGYAQEEAKHFNHPYVGTEHILLGLIRDQEGVAGRVLDDLGVKHAQARSAVEFIVGHGEGSGNNDDLELTASAKKVIEYALEDGRKLNHHYVGTEHVLLGLVRKGEGVAAGVLEIMGVNLEQVRTAVLRELRQGPQTMAFSIDRFTQRSQEALVTAQTFAERNGNSQVEPEHLLLALLEGSESSVPLLLSKLNLDSSVLQQQIRAELNKLPHVSEAGVERGISARLRTVLVRAPDELAEFGDEYISTEHLLLALCDYSGGTVQRVLSQAGLTRSKLLQTLHEVRGSTDVSGTALQATSSTLKHLPSSSNEPPKTTRRRWSIKLARIAGIDVYAHSTLLLLIVYGLWKAQSLQATEIIEGVTTTLFLFFAVVIHELGHAIASRWYGASPKSMTLWPMGGFIQLEHLPERPIDDIIISIAGPVANMFLALLFAIIFYIYNGFVSVINLSLLSPTYPVEKSLGSDLLSNAVSLNIALFLFNLIPVLPLDGGRILRAALVSGAPKKGAWVLRITGTIIALTLCAFAALQGYWDLFFIGAIALLATWGATVVTYARHLREEGPGGTTDEQLVHDSDQQVSLARNNETKRSPSHLNIVPHRNVSVLAYSTIDIFIGGLLLVVALSAAYDGLSGTQPRIMPFVIAYSIIGVSILFFFAGIGMVYRWTPSRRIHILANTLLSLTVIGLIYAIPAIWSVRKERFKRNFFVQTNRSEHDQSHEGATMSDQGSGPSFLRNQAWQGISVIIAILSLCFTATLLIFVVNFTKAQIANLTTDVTFLPVREKTDQWRAIFNVTNAGPATVDGLVIYIEDLESTTQIVQCDRRLRNSSSIYINPSKYHYTMLGDSSYCTITLTSILPTQTAYFEYIFQLSPELAKKIQAIVDKGIDEESLKSIDSLLYDTFFMRIKGNNTRLQRNEGLRLIDN